MAQPSTRGRLSVVSAPSGAGKTTLVRALLQRDPRLKFSISYTTRPPRNSETPSVDYFFVSEPQFLKMAGRKAFLEHAKVFDHWYGTGREHVDSLLADGYSVLLEIDWQGARQVRSAAPDSGSVFILPPSVTELERRLRGRGTDSEATIQRRLGEALADMTHWNEFDHVLVNDDFDLALDRLGGIVAGREQRHRTDSPQVRAQVEKLLAGAGALGTC